MAGRFTFHNKFHRANHHTVSGFDIVDSGLDPIASKDYPFNGIFYNLLTDQKRTFNIETNSVEWWSAYTTIKTISSVWMHTLSLFSTVCSLSDNWDKGYVAFLNTNSLSSRWESTYTTVCAYSAEWGSPYLMFTNKVQEYTHSKTFSGQNLFFDGVSSFRWDLDNQQVGFIELDGNRKLLNPEDDTIINGGLYTLVIKQRNNQVQFLGYELEFDTRYRFNDRNRLTDIVNKTLSGITLLNFLAVDDFMYGDVTFLSGNF